MSDLQRYFQEVWDAEGNTQKLYYTQPLTPDSLVFDIGGYLGDWSQVIARTYNPTIHIFEPIPEYLSELRGTFKDNPKVSIHPYGLGSRSTRMKIYKQGAGSSCYRTQAAWENIEIKDIPTATIEVLGIESVGHARIDFVSINIEGGEYDLFDSIFASGLIHRFKYIMVQFHPMWASSYDDRNRIRNSLLQTHDEVWSFPFIWEMWRCREWLL